jgi:hypothetical protein
MKNDFYQFVNIEDGEIVNNDASSNKKSNKSISSGE